MSYSSAYFESITQASLASAQVVVPLVLGLLHPSSVIDVGCGTGAWLSVFREHGVETIFGLDGEYVDRRKLLFPPDCFRTVDLARAFHLRETFDLALSLEIAEHLLPASANSFVKSLCQVAPVVLFSAAVPGQGGEQHVNEQWPEYWRQLFSGFRFRMFDPFRPLVMHDERVAVHYRQNLFLFIRDDVLRVKPEFPRLAEVKDGNGLMLVAPYILFGNVGFRATLKRLPHLLWESLRERFQRLFLKRTDSEETRPEGGRALP